jgi:hypothetical protein
MKRDTLEEIEEQAKAIQRDYEYMDNIPLEGWAWEFIRRNPNYESLYNEIEHDFKTIDILKGDTEFESIIDNIKDSPIKKKFNQLNDSFHIRVFILENIPCDISKLANTDKNVKKIIEKYKVTDLLNIHRPDIKNFMHVEGIPLFIGIPNPKTKYHEFCCHFPTIEGVSCVRFFKFDENTAKEFGYFTSDYLNKQFEQYCYKVMMNELAPNHSSDTLYFGISLNGKKDDIMQQVKTIIGNYIKPTKGAGRQRDKKWKYYLIAYDLVKKGKSYSKIADILCEAFESNESLVDVKNSENYYKTSLALIKGNYKKYLYLKK